MLVTLRQNVANPLGCICQCAFFLPPGLGHPQISHACACSYVLRRFLFSYTLLISTLLYSTAARRSMFDVLKMHQSIFSYNLSRPYPYPWFTWLVVSGGILATALFSVINLAANSYELKYKTPVPARSSSDLMSYSITTTSDLNTTISESQSRWFEKWSLSQKISATCQAQSITVGSQFYTNNTALAWTVSGICGGIGNCTAEPSIAYSNNLLEGCEDMSISMYFTNESSTGSDGWSISAMGFVSRNVSTPTGSMQMRLSTTILNSEFDDLTSFVWPNPFPALGQYGLQNLWLISNQSSFLWGIFFMMSFGAAVSSGQFNATESMQNAFVSSCALKPTTSATVFLIEIAPNLAQTDNIVRPDYLTYGTSVFNGCLNFTDLVLTGSANRYLDGLAKSFYSLMLTDLGQAKTANILAHPQLIMQLQKTSPIQPPTPPPPHVLQNETTYFNWYGSTEVFYSDPFSDDIVTNPLSLFSIPGVSTTIPVVKSAVISTQYFCQVPQLKSTGSLLIAIIVADLVFLQTLWKILNLAVTFFLTQQHPEAQYCDGCAKRLHQPHEGYALLDRADEAVGDNSALGASVPVAVFDKGSTASN